MVRWALSRRTEPGTTLAPTLNPTFSTNVGSAAVLAASSAGVRKWTPVSFTPSAIRNPTLPTISAAPRRNLCPAFIVCSRGREPVARPVTSSPSSGDSSARGAGPGLLGLLVELIQGRLVVRVLRAAGLELGVVVLQK